MSTDRQFDPPDGLVEQSMPECEPAETISCEAGVAGVSCQPGAAVYTCSELFDLDSRTRVLIRPLLLLDCDGWNFHKWLFGTAHPSILRGNKPSKVVSFISRAFSIRNRFLSLQYLATGKSHAWTPDTLGLDLIEYTIN